MLKFFSGVIGLAMLVVAAIMLWFAFGPQPSEARTTGGVLYTQQEMAAQLQTGASMEAVTDTQSGAMNVPVRPEISAAAAADLQSLDEAEMRDSPSTVFEAEGGGQPLTGEMALTTDIVLQADTQVAVAPLGTGQTATGDGQGGMSSSVTGYEQRVVELEWPRNFQVGRSGAVRVKLKMLESGALQPVAEVDDNEVLATPILITDRYATHDAFVSATISAPDFTIDWVSPARQPLQKGGSVEWRWTLESNEAQSAVISMGLSISWEPKPGQPPGPQNIPIWGQAVQVDVNYVFGLITVPQASILGSALGVLGVIAQYPLLEKMLEITLDIIFGRNRRDERRRRSRRVRQDRRNRRDRR